MCVRTYYSYNSEEEKRGRYSVNYTGQYVFFKLCVLIPDFNSKLCADSLKC